MKKSFKIMGMAAMVLLLAVSCKKENKDENNGEAKFMTFTAGISQGNGKTYLNNNNLLWSEGDAININGSQFSLTEGEDTNKGEFSGTTEETGTYYAVYPASSKLDDGTATITLPAVQPYVDGSFDKNVAPMVAMTDDNKSFTFTNVCGLLRLDFTNIIKQFDKIVLESANGEYLAGEGTVEITGDGNESLVLTDASSNSKSVTMSTSDVTNDSKIVFVLPAGTLKHGFNVYFYNGDVQFDAVSTSADMEIAAGTMNVVTVNHEVKEQAATIQQDAVTTTSLTIPYEIKEECESASIQCATDENFEHVVGTKVVVGATKSNPWKEGNVTFEGLLPATLYHVRILVKSAGEAEEKPYCTIVAETLGGEVPTIRTAPQGALPYKFTINADGDYVFFAKGNLWCNASDIANPVWHFEENQYDTETSYKTNHVSHFYCNKGYENAVGATYVSSDVATNNGEIFADHIEFDGTTITKDGWYVPTTKSAGIWNYIFTGDRMENGKDNYKKLSVAGHDGLCIYPDNYKGNYTEASFDDLEANGVVFLPITGKRSSATSFADTNCGVYIGNVYYYGFFTPFFFDMESQFKYTQGFGTVTACAIRLVHPGLEPTK